MRINVAIIGGHVQAIAWIACHAVCILCTCNNGEYKNTYYYIGLFTYFVDYIDFIEFRIQSNQSLMD